MKDSTYKSKAALQISTAIGTQQIVADYDNIRAQLKTKPLPQKNLNLHLHKKMEKWKYDSLLSQLHTQLLSTKYTRH